MTDNTIASGEERAKRRSRRYALAMIVPPVAAVALLELARRTIGGGERGIDMLQNPTMATIMAAIIVIGTAIAAIWQHRVMDEQEERAMLWGNTVALYCVIAFGFAADILAWAGMVQPIAHMALVVACLVPGIATLLWLRFR